MSDHDQNRKIDELLDSLLSEYSSAEPRPGLENRILAGLQEAAATTPARRWNMQWLWAGAAVAAAVLLAALFMGRHRAVPSPKQNMVRVQTPPRQQPREVAPRGPEKAAGPARHPPRKQVPRQREDASLAVNRRPAIFPTPTPLSEQEQLLLRYLTGTPQEELIAQSRPEEPPVMNPDQSQAIPDLSHVPQTLSNTR